MGREIVAGVVGSGDDVALGGRSTVRCRSSVTGARGGDDLGMVELAASSCAFAPGVPVQLDAMQDAKSNNA
jgi:hypothetical protein